MLFGKRRHHTRHYTFEVIPDIRIAEAERSIAFTRQYRIPCLIMRDVPLMYLPIDLDNEASTVADEIKEVAPERRLSSEVETLSPEAAKGEPETDLWWSHGLSHLTGAFYGIHGCAGSGASW